MSRPIQNDRIARFTELIADEPRVMDELCQRITGGGGDGEPMLPQTLVEVCAAWDIPYSRFASWLESVPDRWERYERALKLRADAFVAEAVPISDGGKVEIIEHTRKDGTVIAVPVLPDHQRDRLRVEARLKVAARWDRARFGAESEAPMRKVVPVSEVTLLEGARRIAFAFEKTRQAMQRQRREPRLLEARVTVEPEPADPHDGDI